MAKRRTKGMEQDIEGKYQALLEERDVFLEERKTPPQAVAWPESIPG